MGIKIDKFKVSDIYTVRRHMLPGVRVLLVTSFMEIVNTTVEDWERTLSHTAIRLFPKTWLLG